MLGFFLDHLPPPKPLNVFGTLPELGIKHGLILAEFIFPIILRECHTGVYVCELI